MVNGQVGFSVRQWRAHVAAEGSNTVCEFGLSLAIEDLAEEFANCGQFPFACSTVGSSRVRCLRAVGYRGRGAGMVGDPDRAQPRLCVRLRNLKSLGPSATHVGLDRSR
jgi:hypothetical protein